MDDILTNLDFFLKWITIISLIVGGVIFPLYKLKLLSRPRLKLKADLEILKLLDPSDNNYQIVKTNVDKLIQTIYQSVRREEEVGRIKMHFNLGNLFGLFFFGSLTAYFVTTGSWWAVLTGIYAVTSLFVDSKKRSAWFSLDNVPGRDSEKLLKFLKDDLNIDWAENAKIRKSDDGKTIRINKDENSAEIIINETEGKATLKIRDVRTRDLKVKNENSKLEISF